MIVCPVCEHPQVQATECEVCGKQLGRTAVSTAPVSPLPELEQTSFHPAPAVAVVAITDLEPNRLLAGPDLPAMRLSDVERTALAPAGAVAVESMGDMDSGRYVDSGPRTQLPTSRVCRYCQNVQADGAICARCGMRLPTLAAEPVVAAPSARAEAQVIKCRQCGSRVQVGQICGGCGIAY